MYTKIIKKNQFTLDFLDDRDAYAKFSSYPTTFSHNTLHNFKCFFFQKVQKKKKFNNQKFNAVQTQFQVEGKKFSQGVGFWFQLLKKFFQILKPNENFFTPS